MRLKRIISYSKYSPVSISQDIVTGIKLYDAGTYHIYKVLQVSLAFYFFFRFIRLLFNLYHDFLVSIKLTKFHFLPLFFIKKYKKRKPIFTTGFFQKYKIACTQMFNEVLQIYHHLDESYDQVCQLSKFQFPMQFLLCIF